MLASCQPITCLTQDPVIILLSCSTSCASACPVPAEPPLISVCSSVMWLCSPNLLNTWLALGGRGGYSLSWRARLGGEGRPTFVWVHVFTWRTRGRWSLTGYNNTPSLVARARLGGQAMLEHLLFSTIRDNASYPINCCVTRYWRAQTSHMMGLKMAHTPCLPREG